MSAAGDAVLAEAYRWIGTTEDPAGSNAGPWWDAFGANYGSWCAAFVSMVVNNALGYPSMCQVDSEAGFMLVSNGVLHEYQTGNASSATGLEAQRTVDLEPGDVVCYSWESWRWYGTPGQGGYPVCDAGAYDGWTAGDHTGVASTRPDGAGYFYAVEGNTSNGGSQDNGGAVLERERHVSQVCGWWRPVAYGGAVPGPEPEPEEEDDDVYVAQQVTTAGPWNGVVFLTAGSTALRCWDPALLESLWARGLCKPGLVEVNDWDVFNNYQVVEASGQAAMG